jgi:hypothetical protein
MGFSYQKIKEIIDLISSEEALRGKIYISGGIVPWLVSNTDSGRQHGDIDLICSQEDMELVRKCLKERNLYSEELDSLNYEQDGEKVDYGVDTYIRGVPVGFYPFEYRDGVIIQRSFSPEFVDGKRDLKVKKITGISLEDYIAETKLDNGNSIGINTLEIIKATKSMVLRGKDITDIRQIDKIGINRERYDRVLNSVVNMYSTLEERKKGREQKERIEKDRTDVEERDLK